MILDWDTRMHMQHDKIIFGINVRTNALVKEEKHPKTINFSSYVPVVLFPKPKIL